ncbi:MAG: hypothetical protein Ct9H300mP30_2350 [Methanobacteriota archaeon]|nr:MAG: hypothetical protein Ct9H300mP30_2350 [Euryarchaeota archaeon]
MVETEHDVALEDTDRLHGRSALVNNVKAATALAGAVRSTLGPRGLDKMLVEDGGPAPGYQRRRHRPRGRKGRAPHREVAHLDLVGPRRAARDGTPTTVILTSELLQNALELVRSGVHPSIIMNGYQIALAESLDEMGRISRTPRDDSELRAVVATSISGKVDSAVGRHLTEIAIEAAEELDGEDGGHDLERMRVKRLLIKDGGTLDSEVVRGLVLPKSRMDVASPADADGGRIAIIDGGMESPELELDASIEVTSTEALRGFHERSRERMREQVDLLASLEIDLLVVRDGIAEDATTMLTDAGITCYRRYDREDLELLSRITGAAMVRDARRVRAEDVGTYTHARSVPTRESSTPASTVPRGGR